MFEKRPHGEWLSLLEISGPFLAEPVLEAHFPQGLDGLDPLKKRRLRQAYDEWREAKDDADSDFEAFHQAWIDLVLKEGLELDEDDDEDVLKPAAAIEGPSFEVPEYGVTISPDYVVVTGSDQPSSLFIKTLSADADLEAVDKADGYAASPVERMVQLCRAMKVRLGLLTNGERWMLIDAPEGEVTSFASWYARLWGQEPITLQAFVNLLGIRRFFLDSSQQLPALLDESVKHQDEVTEALGDQVSRAVEVLIQALDKADQDKGRELLKGIEPSELYEAGLTVMMRLVFLLSAEERGLLLLGDERYEAYYAVSSLRMQLREQAGRHSEEILSHRRDAWARLLAIFRAVYGGVEHESLRMPALGGSLFDPDRFPFFEGRSKGSNWRHDPAKPLPIDNRTVLLLLDAIQLYQGRTLSYRGLDVEQIGYVYEGLLERTVIRAPDITLEVSATKSSKKPWITWGELEDARLSGDKAVKALLEERTGSSKSRIDNDLNKPVSEAEKERLLVVCQGDSSLRDRLVPFYHFLRIDPWGYPLIYLKDSFMVASGSDRRETGTHYTPKSLTESIVKETLEPVVYAGPAEGADRKAWRLKSPAEILNLKVCDLAMGSGAFLVQACRWLSERLIEAWAQSEAQGKSVTSDGIVVEDIGDQQLISTDPEERLIIARRLISERCLYGVDVNPMAVELAKLSIWLVTLAKGRPFGFLDHNLRHGDSLLGITNLDQLYYLDMYAGKGSEKKLFAQRIDKAVKEAIELRSELRARPILDIHDVDVMAHLDQKARAKLEIPQLVADALIGETLRSGGGPIDVGLLSIEVGQVIEGDPESLNFIQKRADAGLAVDLPVGKNSRKPFHWCLEFPEVFSRDNPGFDAIIGNPPFVGGQKISKALGKAVGEYLKYTKTWGKKAAVDLVVYFTLHAAEIINDEGCSGLIVRRSISEGKNREASLQQISNQGLTIYSAKTDVPWPGQASVVVHCLHLTRKPWDSEVNLNGVKVSEISSYLNEFSSGSPMKLSENKGRIFQGVIVQGEGFHISEGEKDYLLKDENNEKIIHPFIGGKEINSDPYCRPKSWVINFWDWSQSEAAKYSEAFSIVESRVRPERQKLNAKGEYVHKKPLPQKWWLYLRQRPALFEAIGYDRYFSNSKRKKTLSRFLVVATGVTKYPAFTFLPQGVICSHKVCVLAEERYAMFGVLSSDIHSVWAWYNKTSMGGDLSSMVYAHGNIFETFPFPDDFFSGYRNDELEIVSRSFYEARDALMKDRNIGLTKFYNIFHDENEVSASIVECRKIQRELNYAVSAAYGWSDLDLDIGFHRVSYLPAGKNIRFTINERARKTILSHLTHLNKQRSQEGSSLSADLSQADSANNREFKEKKRQTLITSRGGRAQMDFFGQEDE